jgi:hypothetical protein
MVAREAMDGVRKIRGLRPAARKRRKRLHCQVQRRFCVSDGVIGLCRAQLAIPRDFLEAQGLGLRPGERGKPETVDMGKVYRFGVGQRGRQMRKVKLAEVVPNEKPRATDITQELSTPSRGSVPRHSRGGSCPDRTAPIALMRALCGHTSRSIATKAGRRSSTLIRAREFMNTSIGGH